jgi:hypothetical protein
MTVLFHDQLGRMLIDPVKHSHDIGILLDLP